MRIAFRAWIVGALCLIVAVPLGIAQANSYREQGKPVEVAGSMTVTPTRDWNRLDIKPGKFAEVWTLDGEQLNEVTFYGGIEPGNPLVKERDRKHDPLPRYTAATLLVEIPELLGSTYRSHKQISSFVVTSSKPIRFLDREGVLFTYEYVDQDNLPRKGEARAVLIAKKLYMITFDAPRLHFFERTLKDFQALSDTARLAK